MRTLFALSLLFLLSITACNLNKGFKEMQENSNKTFGDQHFKTAISLIELHKVRYGIYPDSLSHLKYLGEWDEMIKTSVSYKKLDTVYQLDLVNGWIGKPKSLKYPDEFWQGLGCAKSNLK